MVAGNSIDLMQGWGNEASLRQCHPQLQNPVSMVPACVLPRSLLDGIIGTMQNVWHLISRYLPRIFRF